MRVFFFLILLGIACIGCNRPGVGSSTDPLPSWFPDDQDLAGYKQAFYQVALEQTGADLSKESIPIRFAKLGYTPGTGGTNGMCRIYTNGAGELLARYVEVDSVFFEGAPEGQRRELVFHELGHCSLRRPHRNDSVDGIPLSIMWPVTLANSLFLGRLQTYMSELFSNSYLLNPQAEQLFRMPQGQSSISTGFTEEIYVIELESKSDQRGVKECHSRSFQLK